MASTKAAGQQPSDCDICVKKIQRVDDYSFWNQFDGRSDFKINTLLSQKCIAQAECVKGRRVGSLSGSNTGTPARTKTSEHLYCRHGNTATIADISSVRATGETFISGVFAADHTLCTFFLISGNACFSTTKRARKTTLWMQHPFTAVWFTAGYLKA